MSFVLHRFGWGSLLGIGLPGSIVTARHSPVPITWSTLSFLVFMNLSGQFGWLSGVIVAQTAIAIAIVNVIVARGGFVPS